MHARLVHHFGKPCISFINSLRIEQALWQNEVLNVLNVNNNNITVYDDSSSNDDEDNGDFTTIISVDQTKFK